MSPPENLCLRQNHFATTISHSFRALGGVSSALRFAGGAAKVGTFAYVPKAGAFDYVRGVWRSGVSPTAGQARPASPAHPLHGGMRFPEKIRLFQNNSSASISCSFRALGGISCASRFAGGFAKVGTFAYVPKAGAFGYVRGVWRSGVSPTAGQAKPNVGGEFYFRSAATSPQAKPARYAKNTKNALRFRRALYNFSVCLMQIRSPLRQFPLLPQAQRNR